MAQYGFYFDQTVCAGCHTCQIACKDKNRLEVGTLYRKVITCETGEYPNPGIYQDLSPGHGLQPLRQPGLRGRMSHPQNREGRRDRSRLPRRQYQVPR